MQYANIFSMNAVGGVIILITLILRRFTADRLPKNTFLILWGIVILKLLIPVSFSSQLSIYNVIPDSLPEVNHYFTTSENNQYTQKNIVSAESTSTEDITAITIPSEPVKIKISAIDIINAVQIAGMSAFLAMFTISYKSGIRKFRESLPVHDEFVCQYVNKSFPSKLRRVSVRASDQIKNPLTYGILKPVILLPKDTDFSDRENLTYILTHEIAHIQRFDVLYKLILTLTVSVHWFNPLVWIMYYIANRDIELACDEAVIRKLGLEHGCTYAMTLISMEEKKKQRNVFNHAYSGFSRYAIQERVKAIMKIRKISVISIILAVVVILSVTVIFASSSTSNPLPKSYVCGTEMNGDEPALIVSHPMLVIPNDFEITNKTVRVNSYEDLVSALASEPYPKNIVISSDMTIKQPADFGNDISVPYGVTVTVSEGITLYADSYNFVFSGDLINNGKITVSGCIEFYVDPTKMGDISTTTPHANITKRGVFSTGEELEKYLSEDSPYTEIAVVSTENTLVISKDLLIPKSKTLWLNASVTLHLEKNATLEIRGTVDTAGKHGKTHIIEGTIIGNSFTEPLEKENLPITLPES